MAEDENSKKSGLSRRRQFTVKYITNDGETKEISRDLPDEIDINSNSSVRDFFLNLTLWIIIIAIITWVTARNDNDVISAMAIKSRISTAIQNDADLEVIKQLYQNRQSLNKGIFAFFNEKQAVYPYEIPLSTILEDIRADLFLADNAPEQMFLVAVNSLISEHNQKNPFDKLTKQQKDYFENVRQKAGGSYPLIQNDINNISDELFSKNVLVDTYLSDSKTSLYISIFSLLFALSFSVYQIYHSRPKKQLENLRVLVDGIFSGEDRESTKTRSGNEKISP